MTADTFRALCAELLAVLDDYDPIGVVRREDVITRARAALAEPEPVPSPNLEKARSSLGVTPTELSHAAQAVLDAANRLPRYGCHPSWIAAALRAAADQVGKWESAEELRAIATELEGQS